MPDPTPTPAPNTCNFFQKIVNVPGYWTDISCSSDGQKLISVANANSSDPNAVGIHISSDAGATWTKVSSISSLISCFISKNGQIGVAHDYNNIWVSTNSGASWSQTTQLAPATPNRFVEEASSICASDDGSTIYVLQRYYRNILKTTDYGLNWTSTNITAYTNYSISSIACSSDGSKLLAVGNSYSGGRIFISNDSGTTWSPYTLGPNPVINLSGGCVSSDGMKMMVSMRENGATTGRPDIKNGFWRSLDGGNTWTNINIVGSPPGGEIDFAGILMCSSDFNTIVGGVNGAAAYVVSKNGGESWIKLTDQSQITTRYITGVAVSSNGNIIYFSSNGRLDNSGQIYGSEYLYKVSCEILPNIELIPTPTPTPTPTETPTPTPTIPSCCGQDDKDWWTRCNSLVLNGNFDYRYGNSGTYADTSDWIVQDVGFVGPPHGSNYIGSIYVNLNNSNTCTPGYIQQSFLTTIGQQYKLHFNMAASLDQFNFPEPQELKTFTVSVAGVTKNYVVDTAWQQANTYQGMGWVSESLVFTAVSATTVLRFESTYNGCYGPAIDRIEVCESNCLLSNGDFSLPSSPSGSCVGASGRDNRQGLLAAPPWYVFENCNVQSFYYCDNSKPYDRYVAAEVAANGCFVEQIINTTPGQRYVCTFDMGAAPGYNILYQGQRAIEACIYDATGYTSNTGLDLSQAIFQEIFLIDDVTTGNTYESLGWESKFFEFNATANTTLIRFRSPKHGTEVIHEAYSVIDNISVCEYIVLTPTPTPTTTIPLTPTPTPTLTKECNICFRMACDNVCPQATPTPTPTPTPDIFWPVEIHSPPISDYFSIPTGEEFWSNSLNNNNNNLIYEIRKTSLDETNNKIYVASNTNLVFTVDLSSDTILNKFVVGTNNIVGIEVNPNNNYYYYVLGSHLVAVNSMDNTENILTYVGIGLDIKYEPINNRIYYLSKTDSNFTKLGYWNLSNNTDVTLETFEFSGGSIDAYVHKVCVSLTDLNKMAVVDLLSSNTEYVDITHPKGLTIDTSGNTFLLSSNNITNIDNTNVISNVWQNEGLNNPIFIKININKNKIYIANKNNSITLHDSITGFYIMTVDMPTINGEFTDFKITGSGTIYGVYNNRVVIFDKSALP